MSELEVIARSEQGVKAIARRLQSTRQTVFPVQWHLHVFSGCEVIEIQELDRGGEEFRVIGERDEGIET